MICQHCGASINNPQAKFCPRCGGKQEVADSQPVPKDTAQPVESQAKAAAPQQPQQPQQGQQTWQPWNAQQAQQAQKPQQGQQTWQPWNAQQAQQAQKPQQPQQGQQTWQPWNAQQAQQAQKPHQPQQGQQTWQPWNAQQAQQVQKPQQPQQGQQTWQPWNAQQAQQVQKPQQAQQAQNPQQPQQAQKPQQGQQTWQPWDSQQPQQGQQTRKPQKAQNSLQPAAGTDPAADQKKKKKAGIVILVVAVALVLVVAAALLVTFLFKWSRGFGQNTAQEYQYEEYEDAPEERPESDDAPEAEAEPGELTAQPGSETAPVVFYMPECVGMERRSAMECFNDADCTLVMEYEHSNEFAEGLVIRQSVSAETQLQPGQEVTLVVSMGAMPCPYEYSQKVTVSAPYGSSYATLVLYEWADGDWQEQFRCSATVGKNGISTSYGEGKGYSPEGVFKLGVALSANSIANDTWPFWQVDSNTCVVDDVDSHLYNTIQNKNDLASGISYDSIGRKLTNGTNNVLIYIEHNGNGINSDDVVSGRGSVITLCGCSASIKPTLGCVDISTSNMNTLLSLLDYSQNPHIELLTQ